MLRCRSCTATLAVLQCGCRFDLAWSLIGPKAFLPFWLGQFECQENENTISCNTFYAPHFPDEFPNCHCKPQLAELARLLQYWHPHAHAHAYTCTHMHVHTQTHMHAHTHTHTRVCMHTHTHVCMRARTCMRTHTQTSSNTDTQTDTHPHPHIYIYIYAYAVGSKTWPP